MPSNKGINKKIFHFSSSLLAQNIPARAGSSGSVQVQIQIQVVDASDLRGCFGTPNLQMPINLAQCPFFVVSSVFLSSFCHVVPSPEELVIAHSANMKQKERNQHDFGLGLLVLEAWP